MSPTPLQSHRRRKVLIASGIASAVILIAVSAYPIWDAGAGGLERGERARAGKSRSEIDTRKAPRVAASPDQPGPGGIPVAVPVPLQSPPSTRVVSPPTAGRQPATPLAPPVADVRPSEAAADPTGVPIDVLKAVFRRPPSLPQPRGPEAEQIALGARLFHEKRLSSDHKMSCATCHDTANSFVDGRRRARSNRAQDLPRNTPALWNLASQRAFYWDGRVNTLEAQVRDAIEREGEMDGTIEAALLWLSRDPTYVADFRRAFGGQNAMTGGNLLKALATYERTLTSPDTRFDRWIEGDIYALTERELAGFRLFTGKGRCLACHGGWRFTDDGFHDVGVRSSDPGRQAIAGGGAKAFKTPSLRETVWTAPYMHDGSLRTLDDVVAHYAGKLDNRPSLAPELKRGIVLSASERADLVAFLKTLSSDSRPDAPPLPR